MADFLLELFGEEIPARMQVEAALQLQNNFATELKAAGIDCGSLQFFVTPRRLAILASGLPLIQPDIFIEKKGPKTNAPQAAIDGFLRSNSLQIEQLEKRIVGKDELYFFVSEQKGQKTAILLKSLIEKIIANFAWSKSMRWGALNERWVRPLHSIICLLDGEIIPVEFAKITASNITYGHRFLAPAAISVNNPCEYQEKLAAAKVIANFEQRKQIIKEQALKLAAENNLILKEDEGLLNEVTGLVEYPNLLVGNIDAGFMDLPKEVLISEMRTHQKYFALLEQNGDLAAKFIITSNMQTDDQGKAIIAGNERVIRARFADGRFFYDQDRKISLQQWGRGLANVTFHAKIGTVAEKVERIAVLAVELSQYVEGADKDLVLRAANLCKNDLLTGMVGEFPELQGIIGRYYATFPNEDIAQNEDAKVADAIAEHYLPVGANSPVPTNPVSICVALADKLDSVIEMFKVGEKPTGSKDPFALRRSSLGIIRIILENNLCIPLKDFVNEEVFAFMVERLKVRLKDSGIRSGIVEAVLATGDADFIRITKCAEALQGFVASEAGANLLALYKRTNIAVMNGESDKNCDLAQIDESLLECQEEQILYIQTKPAFALCMHSRQNEDFSQAMKEIGKLQKPVNDFLDNVTVNVEDKKLQENRLKILLNIRIVLNIIADFSLIEA